MSTTNAVIGMIYPDRTVEVVTCRYDGHTRYTGMILFMAYNNKNRVLNLLQEGNMEKLGVYINPKNEWQKKHSCVFYRRNYKEDVMYNHSIKYKSAYHAVKSMSEKDFFYFYDENKWYIYSRHFPEIEDVISSNKSNESFLIEAAGIFSNFTEEQEELKIVIEKGGTESAF